MSEDSGPRAVQLQTPDGQLAGVWMCKVCKHWAHGSESLAEACCEPRACEACDGEVSRYRTVCETCRHAQYARRTAARFEAAAKVSIEDYAGEVVFVEDDEQFVPTVDLEEYLSEREDSDPPRVYATTTRRACIDVDGALDNALDESFEDARESIDADAERELEEMVKAWGLLNLPVTYYQDLKTAVVVWVEQSDGEPCKGVLG